MPPVGLEPHKLSRRATADLLRLGPRGHWDLKENQFFSTLHDATAPSDHDIFIFVASRLHLHTPQAVDPLPDKSKHSRRLTPVLFAGFEPAFPAVNYN